MISVERACAISDPTMRGSNVLGVEGTDNYSLECENAVKKHLRKGEFSSVNYMDLLRPKQT